MPSASERVGKPELLHRLKVGRDRLATVLDAVPSSVFLRPNTIGQWSVRDVLVHLVAHEQRALTEIASARRGERLAIEHQRTAAFNAGAVFARAPLGREDALAAWEQSYRQVVKGVETLRESDFAPGSTLEQWLGETIDGALANNTYAHDAEHLPRLEALVARVNRGREGSV
jgi:DinB superfamily